MGIRWEDTAGLSFSDCRIPAFNHIDGDLKKTLQSFSESRPVVAPMLSACRVPRWISRGKGCARSASNRINNASLTQQPAAADQLLRLEAEWEATGSRWCGRNGSNSAKAPGKSIPRRQGDGGQLARNGDAGLRRHPGCLRLSADHLPENGSATRASSTFTRALAKSNV